MDAPRAFPPLPVLVGDGFTLRPWRSTDAAAFAVASRDEDVVRWTAMPIGLDEADARAWLAGLEERVAAGEVAPFAIADGEDRAVGGIGVIEVDWQAGLGEVYYWLARDARGRGIATAALRLVARWVFDTLGVARLELYTHPDNAPSQRVAERAGFRREGTQRSKRPVRGQRWDLVGFALLAGDAMEPAAAGQTWIGFLHAPREDFAATMTAEEEAVWADHFERLELLLREGRLVLAGPTLGRINTGIVIFDAPDEAAARRFLAEDQTVAGGYTTAELRPFRISLLRGRD